MQQQTTVGVPLDSYLLAFDKLRYGERGCQHQIGGLFVFNGSSITSDLIIHTSEKSDGTGDTEMIETINEKSVGFVKALEMLTSFDVDNGRVVFIYFAPIKQ